VNAVSTTADTPAYRPQLPEAAYRQMTLVLRIGLGIALAILLAALVAYMAEHPGASFGGTLSTNPITSYLSAAGLARGLEIADPAAFLTLGVYVLVATPVVRVLTGVYYFERGRERTMALVTFSVLILLLVGLFVVGPLIR
jgi:uncharacterized membrane protein